MSGVSVYERLPLSNTSQHFPLLCAMSSVIGCALSDESVSVFVLNELMTTNFAVFCKYVP